MPTLVRPNPSNAPHDFKLGQLLLHGSLRKAKLFSRLFAGQLRLGLQQAQQRGFFRTFFRT